MLFRSCHLKLRVAQGLSLATPHSAKKDGISFLVQQARRIQLRRLPSSTHHHLIRPHGRRRARDAPTWVLSRPEYWMQGRLSCCGLICQGELRLEVLSRGEGQARLMTQCRHWCVVVGTGREWEAGKLTGRAGDVRRKLCWSSSRALESTTCELKRGRVDGAEADALAQVWVRQPHVGALASRRIVESGANKNYPAARTISARCDEIGRAHV